MKTAELQPTNDWIIVRRVKEMEEHDSGLYIPDKFREPPMVAEVVAVGPGKRNGSERIDVTVSVGDLVILNKYSGIDIDEGVEDGDGLVSVKEEEILGVLDVL